MAIASSTDLLEREAIWNGLRRVSVTAFRYSNQASQAYSKDDVCIGQINFWYIVSCILYLRTKTHQSFHCNISEGNMSAPLSEKAELLGGTRIMVEDLKHESTRCQRRSGEAQRHNSSASLYPQRSVYTVKFLLILFSWISDI